MPVALTTLQEVGIVAAIVVGVLTVLFAAVSVWRSVVNERKRTQPIVISHEAFTRRFSERPGAFRVGAYLTNEGSGTAFNVRFGVEFHGVRFPYKHDPADDDTGSVQRVLRSSARMPLDPRRSLSIVVDVFLLVGGGGDPDPDRVFWARYESAQGKMWETRNPGNRSERLDIKRVHAVWLHERLEQRRRNRAKQHGAEWEAAAIAELRQAPADPQQPQEPDVQP